MIRYDSLLRFTFSFLLTLFIQYWLLCRLESSRKENKPVQLMTSSMVKDNTPKTSRVTTRADSKKKSETSWGISDDWELIDCILSLSNLPDLKLHDIVYNLNQQKAQVEAIEPVVRLDRLHLFLKSVVNLETVNKACKGWDIVFHGTLRKNVTSIIQHGFRLPGKERHTSRFIIEVTF